MDAPICESSCSATSLKLREGECVEVRQRDKRLQGSWHPATIVGFMPSRCIVEYDQLPSDDGHRKLRGCIPLTKCLQKSSFPTAMSSPLVNQPSSSSMPTLTKKHELSRPAPPVPTDPPSFPWKGGLFVDVFHQESWWEAVLLDDVVTREENTFANVIYVDEGDLARVPVKNLRISQLWDKVTGKWIIKGSCNLSRFLSRRGFSTEEIMQTTSTNQDDFLQCSFVQSKVKLNNGLSSFGLPGGNATGPALVQNMASNAEARAALCGGDCNGDPKDSCTDELGENDFCQGHQSSLQEAGRVSNILCTTQSDDMLEDTGCVDRCEAFESLNCIDNGDLCNPSPESKDGEQAVQASTATQPCIKELFESEGRVDSKTSVDIGKAVHMSNVMEQCSQIVIEGEPKFGLEFVRHRSLGQLVDASCGCEGSESFKNAAKFCSEETVLKDSEKFVDESHTLQQCAEVFSEGVALVGLETIGQSTSGQFGSKNCISQESPQSAPFDIDRVDETSFASLQTIPLDSGAVVDANQTLVPHSLCENTGCLHKNACESPEGVKCLDGNGNQCSCDGEIVHVSKATQPGTEAVSKAEDKLKLETARSCVSQLGSVIVASQDCSQSTCTGNNTSSTPSSDLLTNNLTVTGGSLCRIGSVGCEGDQSLKRSNINVDPYSDIALYQGNQEAVCKVHALGLVLPKEESNAELEHPVETYFGGGSVIESSVGHISGPETGYSLCGKVGDMSALPASLPSDRVHGEEVAHLFVKPVCLPDVLVNSYLLAKPKPSFLTSLLPSQQPSEELTASICKTETGKYPSTGGGFVDCERGSISQKNDGEGTMNSVENDMEGSMVPASLATSSSQGQAESISEAKEYGLGCIVIRSDTGGSGSPVNFMHSATQSWQTTEESDKSDFVEKRSVNCMIKYTGDRSKRRRKNVDSLGSRDAFSHQTSHFHKEVAPMETPEIQATGYGMKRKATDELHERVVRTGFRDKHRGHARVLEGKRERRVDNDTLMSFRDRLVLQKQADACKRKAVESRKASDQGVKSEKKVSLSSRQAEKNEEKETIFTKQNMMELKAKSSLTTSVVKDKTLKLLTRDIAKEALLEAGFRIELRPRKSRAYQDSVYVSPDGHAYWSLPKAWEALKKLQAEKSVQIDSQGSSEDVSCLAGSHEKAATSSMSGEESKQRPLKEDKSALREVFSRFGDDERLQSALTGRNLEIPQNVTKQGNITNADLTDILLGDLGVLRRFTKRFIRKRRSELSKSTDSTTSRLASADILKERRGMKRKQDSRTVPEVFERKILDGRGSSKKSQGICPYRSSEEKKQGIIRSLKQTMLETKATVAKDKKQGTGRSSKQTIPETKATVAKHKNKKAEKPKARSGLRLEVRHSSSSGSEDPACHSTRTVFSWMIDRGAVLEREKIFFVDKGNHQAVKEGVVTREGILCSCCKRVFTAHSFEAHAKSKFGDWHQALVFTSGKRLLDRQLKAWDAEVHLRKAHNYIGISEDDTNDDTCLLCGDGGDLICCDGCPSTFHASCLQIENIPEGDWYCPKCSCGLCGSRQCDEDTEVSRAIVCNQCEHRYHIACLHSCHSFVGKEVFCRSSCEQIFSRLRSLVGISHSLPGGFSWTLLRCMEEDNIGESTQGITQIDCHSKLAVALLVIKECFNTMVDPRTNVDMITHAMYNRWSDFDRLNYAGFYTAVLEKEGEIISVATIRIHGVRLAEMPLIGTREKYRRQGMCRLLVGIIEKLLSSLKVALFVLPAIPELFNTWTTAFGFKPLDSSLKLSLKDISMMVFPGTELLQKPVALTSEEDFSPLQDTGAE